MRFPGVRSKRTHEPDRSLAVERAPTLFEERRLLDELRIAVEIEQLALDLGDGRRAGHAVELLGEHGVVGVEVVEVVGGNDAELVEQSSRQPALLCDLVAVGGDEIRDHVLAVEPHLTDPRQMIEPDLIDLHARRLDAEHPLR